jgi:hypothetical protein
MAIEHGEFIDRFRNLRRLGTVPAPRDFRLKCAAPRARLVPPEQWEVFEIENAPIQVKDQGPWGACNGFAASTVAEWGRWISGQPHQSLSPWFIYAILCGGVDQGSSISQALSLMKTYGTPLEDAVPYGTINPNQLTKADYKQALRFRIEVGSPIRSFDEMMSATQLREPMNFSVCVGKGFDNFNIEGCCGVCFGPGNHAVVAGLGAKHSTGGNWLIKCQNSWGVEFGQGGYFWISRRHIESQSHFDAYTVRSLIEDPADKSSPVAVKTRSKPPVA